MKAQEQGPPAGKAYVDSIAYSRFDTLGTGARVDQVDIGDVLKKLFRGRRTLKKRGNDSLVVKPIFSGLPVVGYTLTTRLAASLSGNMIFRTDTVAKLSAVTASAVYTQNRQLTLPVESNIWTRNNHFNLLGDYRFYKYPQSTFGLGSGSNTENEQQLHYYLFRFSEIVQTKIFSNFYAGLGYMLETQWGIKAGSLPAGKVSEFSRYDSSSNTTASGVIVNAVFDGRSNPINPSKGFYSSVQYRNNLTALGSERHWQSMIIDTRKYFNVPDNSRNIWAFWSYDWLIIQGKPPFLDLPSTTWDQYSNTGRGYIQGRFRGSQMVYLETEYRMVLTENGLLGAVAFLNAESLSGASGSRLQAVQPGFGTGLRVRLNKKSGTNLSIDYGFGTQGSRGLFVNIGEVF